MKRVYIPEEMDRIDRHQLLLGTVAPRPIALVSSYNKDQVANLAPYSFFMGISSSPPIVAFSAAFKAEDPPEKDTLKNALYAKELVINVVSAAICKQMTLTSIMYPPDISEFDVAGFTIEPAELVDAPMVLESPINMECKVLEIKNYGDHPGAGNLVVCEVLRFHVDTDILGEKDRIDPDKLDLMGRMGRAYYTRASGKSIYTFYQPVTKPVIGMDRIPEHIRNYQIDNEQLTHIAALEQWPSEETIAYWTEKFKDEITPFERISILIETGHYEQAFAALLSIPKDNFPNV